MKLLIGAVLLALVISAPVAVVETVRDTGGEVAEGVQRAARPAADAAENAVTCERRKALVVIDLNNRTHRHILDHAWDAIDAGQPRLLHWDPKHARQHRDEWHATQGDRFPTRDGYDRDEYPPAASREGGADTDLRYVESSENRSAGSVMGSQLHRFCTGQRFRFEKRPR